MPQSPIVLNNQQMPAARTYLNQLFEAFTTGQSGSAAPSTTYPFMRWIDTSTSPATERVRNSANNAWIVVGTMDTVRLGNAPLAAPTFTGAAQCTNTAGATANDFQIANTAHVKLALANHGAWFTPTLGSGWTANATIQYRITSDGMLQIKGAALFSGTVGTSSQIFVLPVGFRPIQTHQPKIRYNGTTVYVLQIQTDGQVLHTAGASLTGIFQDFDIIIPLN
jgi:hypothetical protein